MWSDLDKGFWAINFDLDTKKAEEFHPSHTRKGAYEELKKFFIANGFAHRQYSGYISENELEAVELRYLIKDLVLQAPHIKEYVRKMDATIIKPEYIYDCKELFDEDSEVVEYTGEVENFLPQPKVQESRSVDQSQSEDIIPLKPLGNTIDEDKTEVVKKTPKIKM